MLMKVVMVFSFNDIRLDYINSMQFKGYDSSAPHELIFNFQNKLDSIIPSNNTIQFDLVSTFLFSLLLMISYRRSTIHRSSATICNFIYVILFYSFLQRRIRFGVGFRNHHVFILFFVTFNEM